MRFYGFAYQELYGDTPIPTPVLDRLWESMQRLMAREQLDLINAVNTKSVKNNVLDWEKRQKQLIEVIDPKTEEEKIEEMIKSWEAVFKMAGKEMPVETREAFRKARTRCQQI